MGGGKEGGGTWMEGGGVVVEGLEADAFPQIMYGVLYAISPEIFPAKDRGTGNALVSTTTRVFGVVVSVPAAPYARYGAFARS